MVQHSINIIMKKLILILCFLAIGSPSFAQISLSTAVDRAITSNRGLKSAEKKVASKSESVSSARGRYLPTINFDITYNVIDNPIILDLDPIRTAMIELQSGNSVYFANVESTLKTGAALPPEAQLQAKQAATSGLDKALPHFRETLKEKTFPKAQFTLNQPIFTGGKINAGVNAAQYQMDAEQESYNDRKAGIVTNVVSYYLAVLLSEENVKVRADALNAIDNHAKRAEAMLREGLIAPHDKLRADVALSEANRNLYEAKELLNISKMAFNLALDTAGINAFSDKLEYKDCQTSLEEFIAFAEETNPQLRQIRSGFLALNEKADAEFASYFPTIYGFGMYDVFDHYRSAIDPKWAVGVGANWTLFNGMRRTNDYQAAKLEAESMDDFLDDARNKIELAIRKYYMEAKLAEYQYNSLTAALEQAKENFRLNNKRYESGLGTSIESIDAELSLEAVSLKKMQSLKDYFANLSMVYQLAGRSEEFIIFWNN